SGSFCQSARGRHAPGDHEAPVLRVVERQRRGGSAGRARQPTDRQPPPQEAGRGEPGARPAGWAQPLLHAQPGAAYCLLRHADPRLRARLCAASDPARRDRNAQRGIGRARQKAGTRSFFREIYRHLSIHQERIAMTTQEPNETFSENTDDAIHRAVRERYAAIASGSTSCCGGSDSDACCDSQRSLYDPELLADLPVDVTGLSLGCGDPVSIASLNPGETVLDLGSGGGIDCFLAARQVGESGYVIGVDMTPEMIAKANASKSRMGVTNVEFRQGQIEALPVDNNSVDVILSNCVINLAPDKAAVF